MLFTAGVLVPATRDKLLRNKKGAFFALVGEKFSRISWVLFIVLIITGVTNLITRGYAADQLLRGSFWTEVFGGNLFIKLHLFALVLIVSGVHDFYAGPKAVTLLDTEPDSPRTDKMRKMSSWLGRLNLLLGLGILYYAMRLLRG
nr:CopD family protein [Fodinibius sediminis]